MTTTDRILAQFEHGQATSQDMAKHCGIGNRHAANLVEGLIRRGLVEKVGSIKAAHTTRPLSLYALVSRPTPSVPLVSAALASRPDLARVWA